MQLRGYDNYVVTLGDEVRGERASLGKSLADAERDLRIKAKILEGIENADLSAFPNDSVIAGYVRSYARYLGMDPDVFYRRFCAEAGFAPPSARLRAGEPGGAAAGVKRYKRLEGSPFEGSRFAVQPPQRRFAARVSLGSLASVAALMLLMTGLGYGGYALLQNIQRMGFEPLTEAPDVVAEAPRIALPDYLREADGRPSAEAYSDNGALAASYLPSDTPPMRRRDGPISAIDARNYGVFAGLAPQVSPRQPEPEPSTAPVSAEATRIAEAKPPADPEDAATVASAEPIRTGVVIHAAGEAWIRVRNKNRATIFEGILAPGDRFELPERTLAPTLRAGNAGDVFLVVNGAPYGPVGRPGGVAKNLLLEPAAIAERFEPTSWAALDLDEETMTAEQRTAFFGE